MKKIRMLSLAVLAILAAVLLASCGKAPHEIHEKGEILGILDRKPESFDGCSKYVDGRAPEDAPEGLYARYACADCGGEFVDALTSEDLGLPILSFEGSLDGISKQTKKTVAVKIEGLPGTEGAVEGYATLKVQGNTSAAFPKKNFTMTLFTDETLDKKQKIELFPGMGKQSKYCLKANYIDASQARNVVSARLYREISKEYDDALGEVAYGGVVDGFPCVILLNGEFHGIYTFNIPKEDWLFGMKDGEENRQAIVGGDAWNDVGRLRAPTDAAFTTGLELEYASTEDTAWVSESFNRLVSFVDQNDGEAFRAGIGNYLSVDRAIDTFLYTTVICAYDNTAKNILWVTFDGERWAPSMYDMDGTWGLKWDGTFTFDPKGSTVESFIGNAVWEKIVKNYPEEIKERYRALRAGALSDEKIRAAFDGFFDTVPGVLRGIEEKKWTEVPSVKQNTEEQILSFSAERLSYLDEYYGFTENR